MDGNFNLEHPCSGIIAGPSGSGKTQLALRLLQQTDEFFDVIFSRIEWYYSDDNSLPNIDSIHSRHASEIVFINTLPEKFINPGGATLLIVIDDMMDEAMDSLAVSQLFTKGVHHQSISVMLLTQNIYNPGKYARNISLNSSFYILFRNLRDQQQITKFFQQMCPHNYKALQKVYNDATSRPHGYLFVDFSQSGHSLLRFRSNITDKAVVCYCRTDELTDVYGAHSEKSRCGEAFSIYAKNRKP